MYGFFLSSVAILALAFVIRPNTTPAPAQKQQLSSYSDVKPIIDQRCKVCHRHPYFED